MDKPKEVDIRGTLEHLASAQKKAMNRQLASEALLYSLLEIIPAEMLSKLEEEYGAALLRLAEQVPPNLQIPEMWESFSQAIVDQKISRRSG